MSLSFFDHVLSDVHFQDYQFIVIPHEEFFEIKAHYIEADTITGEKEVQWTRGWMLDTTADRTAIVSTCFKCAMTSMEHRTREWFLYKGRAIYQPHYDVEQLHEICEDRTT